jgi:hypothetical protein
MSTMSRWAVALLDPDQDVPQGLLTWNASSASQRVGVHRNNVMVSLVDALASTFAVTQQLVGEPFFRAMAQLYVRQHPPRTPVLGHYGDDFAEFVAQFPPAASVPYLADVARLEFLRLQTLHAADAQPMLTEEAQAWLDDAEQLAQVICTLAPGVQPFHSVHAALSVWAAHQPDSGLTLEEVDVAQPESGLIFRSEWDVMVLQTGADTARFVAHLQNGYPLGDAWHAVSTVNPAWNAVQALALLFRHGLVTHLGLPVLRPSHGTLNT